MTSTPTTEPRQLNQLLRAFFVTPNGHRLPARLAGLSAFGAHLEFPTLGSPSVLPGTRGTVEFHSAFLSMPLTTVTTVTGSHASTLTVTLAVTFTDPQGLHDRCPAGLRHLFGQRLAERLVCQGGEHFAVSLEDELFQHFEGATLKDLSRGGLSLWLPAGWERQARPGRKARVTLRLPGDPDPLSLWCDVAHVERDGERCWVGLTVARAQNQTYRTQQDRLAAFLDRELLRRAA